MEELQLKFFSVIHPTRAFLPQLEQSGEGAIVCVNSLLAQQPEPHMVATSAARAGVLNLVRSMATEFAPKGVRVNGILIGLVESGQWRRRFEARPEEDRNLDWAAWTARLAQQKHIPLGRLGLPVEAARAILFLASPLSSYTTGSHIDISGGTPVMPNQQQYEQQQVTVGCAITAFLEQCGVKAAFGVISIHNMPILDAMGERGKIRFVPARGEAGGTNMADACARTTGGLGVCLTSTGTAAGNAAGAMVEALTAGTPMLHITGQIETPYLDQSLAYIHEAPDQLTMLKAVSKAAFRVRSADTAISTIKLAVQTALTAPTGPVSVEIPIDIQAALIDMRPTSSRCRCRNTSRRPMRWTRWPSAWPRPSARCCGWAVVHATRASRSSACSTWASAWSPAHKAAASSRKTIRARSAPTTCTSRSSSSTRAATRCWWSVRACAAMKR